MCTSNLILGWGGKTSSLFRMNKSSIFNVFPNKQKKLKHQLMQKGGPLGIPTLTLNVIFPTP